MPATVGRCENRGSPAAADPGPATHRSAALPGSETDHLASQGSLVYDAAHKLLIAVNAGSDSVTTFRVQGDRLGLADVVASGGGFPASVAVHRNLVYVLNAGGAGSVTGFRIVGNDLRPIPGSDRLLGNETLR